MHLLLRPIFRQSHPNFINVCTAYTSEIWAQLTKKSSHKIKYKKIPRGHRSKQEEIIMRLLDSELNNKEQWEKAEIRLPQFDRQAMKEATKKTHSGYILEQETFSVHFRQLYSRSC